MLEDQDKRGNIEESIAINSNTFMLRRGPEALSVNNIAMAALCSMSINTVSTSFKIFNIDLNRHRQKIPVQAYIYECIHRTH